MITKIEQHAWRGILLDFMEQCSDKCSNDEDTDAKSFAPELNVFVICQAQAKVYTFA